MSSAKQKSDKPTLFTTINAISAKRPLSYSDLVEMGAPYNAFMVNRALSLYPDTTIAASLMNLRSFLDNEIQAEFLIHSIRPKKRFGTWPKGIKEEAVNIIAKYYGMSKREARHVESLHTTEQIAAMSRVLQDGALPSRVR